MVYPSSDTSKISQSDAIKIFNSTGISSDYAKDHTPLAEFGRLVDDASYNAAGVAVISPRDVWVVGFDLAPAEFVGGPAAAAGTSAAPVPTLSSQEHVYAYIDASTGDFLFAAKSSIA